MPLLENIVFCDECYAQFSASLNVSVRIDTSGWFSFPELTRFSVKVFGQGTVRQTGNHLFTSLVVSILEVPWHK
jgi:hypothetical protein